MKIGTFIINVYGELLEKDSPEILQNIMHQPLFSISDGYDSDFRRFEYFAATLIWVVPLKIFWKNDIIYNTLIRGLNKYFDNWTLDISVLLHGKQS